MIKYSIHHAQSRVRERHAAYTKKQTLGPFLFCLAALWLFCPPAPAPAATVNFNSGTANQVVGNPLIAGSATGIGGTGSLPTNNANGSGNTVNVTGGIVNSGIYGGVHQTNNSAYASAMGNTVNVGPGFTGKTSNFWVYGGYAQIIGPGGISAVASGNSVNINGGSFFEVFGGYALNTGGSATADNNTVHFASGTTSYIYGGYAQGSATIGESSASGNHVIISGGTVTNAVYGGWARYGARRVANNNTVTILGSPDLFSASLYGGSIETGGSGGGSGNTLEMKTAGVTARQISGFQNLHFFLPDSVSNGDIVLDVTNTAFINGAEVYVGMSGNDSPLQIGDTVTLIDAGSLNGTPANGSGRGMQGISKAYTFAIHADQTTDLLTATVLGIEYAGDGGQVDAQLKALDESRMAGLALLTQGQDLLEAQAIPQLRRRAPQKCGPVTFAVTGGGSLRYHSGSHVDVESLHLITGLGWNAPLHGAGEEGEKENGNVLLGAFFETGQGGYDSRNSFGNAAIKGHGDSHYFGGGLLARYDSPALDIAGLSGNFYLEASLRAGHVDTDFKSSDIMTASLSDVDFSSSSAYYGLHTGLGYIWNITEAASLDLYSKYLWTRQESDTVIIEGDSVHFKSVDSQRWRNGARFSLSLETDSGPAFTPYLGAAYEQEYDSKARAACNGTPINAPDLKGGTGIGELGLGFKPSGVSGLSLDLAVQGYSGKREGVGGSLQAQLDF